MVDVDALAAPTVRFFVARLDGRIMGCGALVLNGKSQAEIKRMFVDPEARGHGVGRAFLEAIERAASDEGICLTQLETGTSNHEALGLDRPLSARSAEHFHGKKIKPASAPHCDDGQTSGCRWLYARTAGTCRCRWRARLDALPSNSLRAILRWGLNAKMAR
jgi:putative acetyltransferase